MNATHLIAAGQGTARLVHDDVDRVSLLRRVVDASGPRLLAYCLMDTHIHVVFDGADGEGCVALTQALRSYVAGYERRHGTRLALRGPVAAFPITSMYDLGRTIRYDHENPLHTSPPLVAHDHEFPWSSARAFRGLTRTTFTNTRRALELLGPQARGTLVKPLALADLEPARAAVAGPGLLLAAIAQTFGLLPVEVASKHLGDCRDARAAFVALGRLEAYDDVQLAPFIGRSRSQACRLASLQVDEHAVRVARTLLRDPGLAAHLRPRAAAPSMIAR